MSSQLISHARTTIESSLVEGLAVTQGEVDAGAMGRELPLPRFATGLSTLPQTLPRQALGFGAQLIVPPGTWAVAHLPGGVVETYTPGSYWIWCQPGAVLVQWVDARRQQVPVGPIEGFSADKWRVRLWLVIDIAVADPILIAAHREPLSVLGAVARAATLTYIERHSHAALTGCDEGAGGLERTAQALVESLQYAPALAGLEIIGARVVERQGDERQIEAATTATVAAAQIDEALRVEAAEHRATLRRLESQAMVGERQHNLRMAATAAAARERLLAQQAEVQQAALAARLDIVLAQIRAQTAEIAHDEQTWQAEQVRLQGEWDHIQRQRLESHQTDQQVRLLEAHQGLARAEGELALAAQDRQSEHALALAEVQQRIAEQRARQAEAVAERRAQHERTLLELHLRHEAMVAEQMQKLEAWRSQQVQVKVREQRQHDRQLAGIAGAAQIAAAAATQSRSDTEPQDLADAGLKLLQDMAE